MKISLGEWLCEYVIGLSSVGEEKEENIAREQELYVPQGEYFHSHCHNYIRLLMTGWYSLVQVWRLLATHIHSQVRDWIDQAAQINIMPTLSIHHIIQACFISD